MDTRICPCMKYASHLFCSKCRWQILTGWPSFTDSDVNRKFCNRRKSSEHPVDEMKCSKVSASVR